MSDEEKYVEIIVQTKEWFEKRTSSLQSIIDLKDESKIIIADGKGEEIELPEMHRKGFIMGIRLALNVLGEYPVSVTKNKKE